jgi:hypothetical protein
MEKTPTVPPFNEESFSNLRLNTDPSEEKGVIRICTENDLEERAKYSSKEDLIRLLDLSNENYRLLKQYVSLRERSNFLY